MSECCVKKDATGLVTIRTKTEPIKTRVWLPLLLIPVFVLLYLNLEKGTIISSIPFCHWIGIPISRRRCGFSSLRCPRCFCS